MRLLVSVAPVGLTKPVGRMFQSCAWQRCEVCSARNLLQSEPNGQEKVAVALHLMFTQKGCRAVEEPLNQVPAMASSKFPRVAEHTPTARVNVLAFHHFCSQHWRKRWSTNQLERVKEETKAAPW